MKIDGKKISEQIIKYLKKEVKSKLLKSKKKGKIPKLVVFSVGGGPQDISFIKAKAVAIKKIGGRFELVSFKKTPRFEDFVKKVKKIAEEPETTAVVIQQPLPASLLTESLYNFIPTIKEIEGHKKKTPFFPPIGLAVLTIIKYIFKPDSKKKIEDIIVDMKKDTGFLKKILKKKRIVVIGRGETGGKPIVKILSEMKVNFINTNSKTPNPEVFYKEADIIISAAGRKILNAENVKPGSALISVGIRQESNQWLGDYDEAEIKRLVGFYTPTPGGIGPLDIAYLMHNIVLATKIQAGIKK